MSRIVKICGLRDPANIREVIRLKPEMIGLIFHPGSPRFVAQPEKLAFLNHQEVKPVVTGVFVNEAFINIMTINNIINLDYVQLHGSETPEECLQLKDRGFGIIKVFGVKEGFDFAVTEPYEGIADFLLFDTANPLHGGTGNRFDWSILSRYKGITPFLLSGGISPETTGFPNHRRMEGVDLNSRFETSPGNKDTEALNTFIKKFRDE